MLSPFANQLIQIVAGVMAGWSLQLAARLLIAAATRVPDPAVAVASATSGGVLVAPSPRRSTTGARQAGELLVIIAAVVLALLWSGHVSGYLRINIIVLAVSVGAGALASAVEMTRRGPRDPGVPVGSRGAGLIGTASAPAVTLAALLVTAWVAASVVEAETLAPTPTPSIVVVTATPTPTQTPTPRPSPTTTPSPSASVTPSPTTPAAATRTVTLTKLGTGTGLVRSRTEEFQCAARCLQTTRTYAAGQKVTLVAEPTFGSRFAGWSGACGGALECGLDLSADRAVNAQFDPLPPPLGYQAQFSGESARLTLAPGQSAQVTVQFANSGSQSWTRGTATQVDLAHCCPVNVPSQYGAWTKGPDASTYAGASTATTGPGQIATYTYTVTVPPGTPAGSYLFEGRLILRSDGAIIPGGAFAHTIDVR